MRIYAFLPVCALAWMLSGCATSMRPVVYRPSSTHPRVIEYKSGSYAGRTRFVADGTYACYEHYRWQYGPSDGKGFALEGQIQTVPDAKKWEKFWLLVDALELALSKSSSSQSDVPTSSDGKRTVVMDASHWSITVTTLRGKQKFVGEGSYPVAVQPERVVGQVLTKTREQDATELLKKAFEELILIPMTE